MPQQSYSIPNLAPGEWHESELVIRRSRFLTHITKVSSPAEARLAIEEMRTRHADATHNCWAFNAGPPDSTAQVGANDDGEPHGTAGRPMLGILLHSGIGNLCCVVTRWFGGIKLGTGGLVRAYQDSTSQCLETLPVTLLVSQSLLALELHYTDNDRVRRLLAQHGASIREEDYGANIRITLTLPCSAVEQFSLDIAHATCGRAQCTVLQEDLQEDC